jgi:hypothetical protein
MGVDHWIVGLLGCTRGRAETFRQSTNPLLRQSIPHALGVSWWKRPARGSSLSQVLRRCCSQRAWLALDSGMVNAGSRAGHSMSVARNPGRRFPNVSCPGYRPKVLGKSCLPVESVARRHLGLAPLPVAGVLVDSSTSGRLLQKASLGPFTHRHTPDPSPRIGRQSPRSLTGTSS